MRTKQKVVLLLHEDLKQHINPNPGYPGVRIYFRNKIELVLLKHNAGICYARRLVKHDLSQTAQ